MKLSVWKIVRLVAAFGLGIHFAEMYIRNGWMKFDPNGFWTPAFVRWGYPPWMRVGVGIVETVGGAMLVIPWLASYGGIAVAVIMLGALVTRMHDGRWVDSAWIAAFLVGLLWIAFEWWPIRIRLRSLRRLRPIPTPTEAAGTKG